MNQSRQSRSALLLAYNMYDASKLFEYNWGIPQFHKRLRVLISIPPEAQYIDIALYLFPVRRVNERGGACLLKHRSPRPLVRRLPPR